MRLAIVAGSLLVAVLAVFAGPTRVLVCGTGNALDRFAQRVSRGIGGGHIDGADASYCMVPATATWALAAAVVVAGVVVAARRPRRRDEPLD